MAFRTNTLSVVLDSLKRYLHSSSILYQNLPASLDNRTKSTRIQSSIKLYLKKVQAYDSLMATEREEFDRGKRYLAQIMGEDPATFSQDQINEAIQYLFPSGLFSKRARPKLLPPEEIHPKEKNLQCDADGRPLSSLFYTLHPELYTIMNELVYQLETLKIEYDKLDCKRDRSSLKDIPPLVLVSSEWFTKKQLEDTISELIYDDKYEQWLNLMNKLAMHPLASQAQEFIMRYRTQPAVLSKDEQFPEPLFDSVTNRHYIHAYGQKRRCLAEAHVYMPGSGKIIVNEKRLLEVFPELGNREQIMHPFVVTRTLGQVDVVAKVHGVGNSSLANALRLAISRCLASLLPVEEGKNRLHVSGLLTQDNRFAERKNPGQKKARKKPIWKAR